MPTTSQNHRATGPLPGALRRVSERRLWKQTMVGGWLLAIVLVICDFLFFRAFNWGHIVNLATAVVVIAITIAVPVERDTSRRDLTMVWFAMANWLGIVNVTVMAIADQNTANSLILFLPMLCATLLFARQPLLKWLVMIPAVGAFVLIHVLSGTRQDVIEIVAITPLMLAICSVTGMLFARMRSSAEEQLRMQGTATALLMALEARDGYTADHSNEVLDLVDGVARRLGLGEQQRRVATYVALLHDIGKIGIPNEILHKPGKLTAEEWVVMKEHPAIGERILRELPGFEPVARAVRHEHERWDGLGYPDGLKDEEIPIYSRIVLVCDAYHAITSSRPYRKALTESYARTELLRNAGSQFDPTVIDALLLELEDRQMAELDDRAEASRHLESAYQRALDRVGADAADGAVLTSQFEEARG